MTGPPLPAAHDRLLRAIRITRGALVFSMLAAAMMVAAAVIAADSAGLTLAAKLACLFAAMVALALMVLNLLALRAWRRGRRAATRE